MDRRERIGERLAADELGRGAGRLFQHHDLHRLADAMLRIGIRRQFEVQRQRATLRRFGPGAARCVHAIGQDCGAAASGADTHQGGAKMPERCLAVGVATDAAREGRIDEDGRGLDRWFE